MAEFKNTFHILPSLINRFTGLCIGMFLTDHRRSVYRYPCHLKHATGNPLTLIISTSSLLTGMQRYGNDNIYIFGQSSKQVIHHYAAADYCARDWYEADPNLHRAIDFLTSEEMLKYGDEEHLKRLQHELISKDWFQTLPDFNAYVVRKEQAMKDYAVNPEDWSRRTLINIAEAGFFSSDRTIAEYDQDIWHLGK